MEQSMFAERLTNFKMKDSDLATFSQDFGKLAIGATPILGKYRVNELYSQAVKPAILSAWLQPWRYLPLPQLQHKAMQMEQAALSELRRTNNIQNNRPFNYNRVFCITCKQHHDNKVACKLRDNNRNSGSNGRNW